MKGKFEVFLRFSVKLQKSKVKGKEVESDTFSYHKHFKQNYEVKKGNWK